MSCNSVTSIVLLLLRPNLTDDQMKKTHYALFSSLLLTCVCQAATTVTLNQPTPLPGDNFVISGTIVDTPFTTGGGATFDIRYTISAVSNDTGAVVGVIGGVVGVGSDNDINPQHFNTLEGNGSAGANGSTAGGEGLSYIGLSIVNFQANASGLTEADITNLRFEGLTLGAVANNQDGVTLSFTDFVSGASNVTLNSTGTGAAEVFTVDLTDLPNYDPTADDLFVEPDNGNGSNRFNVTGLSVSFVPEPSSSALLLGSGVLLLLRRRRL